MNRQLPLNALRAFEATARAGSFTSAAAELGVTPAAVGQQVRALESRLGRPLFARSGDGLTLVPDAAKALADVRRGFDSLSHGFESLSSDDEAARISISVPPTFAIRWLVPRLHSFYERYPEIEVSFDTAMRFVDIARGEVDLAIRFGSGRYPGLQTERLLEEWVLPLCAPTLCRDNFDLLHSLNTDGFPLLHLKGETTDPSWITWRRWAENQGLESARFEEGSVFTQSATALQAAVEGQGIALCGITYALDEILAGKLCAPCGTNCAVRTEYAYDIVYTQTRAERYSVRALRRWIKGEAVISQKSIDEYLSIQA